MTASLDFSCPHCGSALTRVAVNTLRCPADGAVFPRERGIWRLLPPAREAALAQFMRDYETIRQQEGRGDAGSAYYRALPFRDLSGRFVDAWRIRGASFRALVDRVVPAWETALGRAGVVLDVGAGSGWLAYRLAQRGHRVAAVDLQINDADGLGAHTHYDAEFVPVQAEFDRLPFPAAMADLLVFNASLHYSTDYVVTLGEALRVLRPEGVLVVLDSPLYRHTASGRAMVQRREAAFTRRFGFPSSALPSEHYLSVARLRELEHALGIRWTITYPRHGVRFALRRWRTRLLEHREAARFPLLVARGED